jgi:hypothetical protein
MSDHIKTTIKQAAQLLNPMNNRDIIGLSNERRRTKAKGHKWSTGCKGI